MAKWGEGDPRWIVEERPDATNVNNWHWSEKNADHWSKKKLEELLVGLEAEGDGGVRARVTELEKCEGEARANNRKAKLIFFYEWELVLKWVGGEEDKVEGKVTVPNLSEEHTDMGDVDLEVTITKGKGREGAEKAKELMRKGEGAAKIRRQFERYVECLKTEFGQGLILPPAGSATRQQQQQERQRSSSGSTSTQKPKPEAATATKQGPGEAGATRALKDLGLAANESVETIKMKERFKCTGQELYNVLTQREMAQVFTRGPVKMDGEAKAGMEFEMLGGNVRGSFLELKPFTLVRQRWRLSSWPEGHFSEVEFKICQSTEDTKLEIMQTKVPAKFADSTRNGWKRYYFEAIKATFGFGSSIF